MYNRYIPGADGYVRVVEDDPPYREIGPEAPPRGERVAPRGMPGQDLLRQLTAPLRHLGGEDKNAGVAGILKSLDLGELDSGDILLLLIMLFLFLEGDNLELVITLGLMLLFSLNDGAEGAQKE